MKIRTYRRLAVLTTSGVCFLVVAGGIVRLTGSGLGCDDWPNCNDTRFIDVSSGHAAIEQINRLVSGLIGIPTLIIGIGSFFVRERSGLRWPALGLLITIFANGVVGGMAVRGDLHPALVQSHFLLAMASVAFGMVAIRRSGSTPVRRRPLDPAAVLLTVGTAAALATGTVVTGTGPHAGDEEIRRFGFDISSVAEVHSVTVLITLAFALWFAWRRRDDGPIREALSAWIFLGVVQAGVGYLQYFTGVPEILVGVHLALATALWALTIWLVLLSSSDTGTLPPGHEVDEPVVAEPRPASLA